MRQSAADTAPLPEESRQSPAWFVYMVRCRDNSLYTGITTDLAKRLVQHNSDQEGARYTRGRRPVHLVYAEQAPSRSVATKREGRLKRLDAARKNTLVRKAGIEPESVTAIGCFATINL